MKTLKKIRKTYIIKYEPGIDEKDTFNIEVKGNMHEFTDECDWDDFCKPGKMPNMILDVDLRREAIRHIKAIEKRIEKLGVIKEETTNNTYHSFKGKIYWIKWFFNITEEELK